MCASSQFGRVAVVWKNPSHPDFGGNWVHAYSMYWASPLSLGMWFLTPVFLLVTRSQILRLAVGDGQEKSRPCQGERSEVSSTHSNATELIHYYTIVAGTKCKRLVMRSSEVAAELCMEASSFLCHQLNLNILLWAVFSNIAVFLTKSTLTVGLWLQQLDLSSIHCLGDGYWIMGNSAWPHVLWLNPYSARPPCVAPGGLSG